MTDFLNLKSETTELVNSKSEMTDPPGRGIVIAGPPRPHDQWPGPRRQPPPPVVGDALNPRPYDTHFVCPYVSSHVVSVRKFRKHIGACRKAHTGVELKMCPFNASHEVEVRVRTTLALQRAENKTFHFFSFRKGGILML